MHHVHRSCPGGRFPIQLGPRPHVIRNIGNMNPNFPATLPQGTYGQGIIEILGILGIDGHGGYTPKIPSAQEIFRGKGLTRFTGLTQSLRSKMQGESKFNPNSRHLCRMLSGTAQPFGQFYPGPRGRFRPVQPSSNGLESLGLIPRSS